MANEEEWKLQNSKVYRTTFLDQTERPLPIGKDYNRESEGNGKAFYRSNGDKWSKSEGNKETT